MASASYVVQGKSAPTVAETELTQKTEPSNKTMQGKRDDATLTRD